MKTVTLSCLALTFLALGCSKVEDAQPAAGANLPTQDELDKKAASEINDANADQKMKELEQEIEQDR